MAKLVGNNQDSFSTDFDRILMTLLSLKIFFLSYISVANLLNYSSRVVITSTLLIITTLES